MAYYTNQATTADKLWGQTLLAPGQASVLKKTYLLLGLSVAAALVGGAIGASSPFVVGLFSSWLGWILALVVLNVVPRIAIAARDNPVVGTLALAGDGFISGLVLAPILAYASAFAPNLILAALLITALVFVAVTGYIMTTKREFSAPRGLMIGMFASIIGATILNGFLHIGILSVLIAAAIGIFGVMALIYSTSDVLRQPESASPVPGALMLFAGLFNIFVSALNILLSLSGGRSRD